MNKYQNGKIYKLSCLETGQYYIGSTCKTLENRLQHHKYHKKCMSVKVLEYNNYKIDLIVEYPCDSNIELRKKEAYYQRLYKNDSLCVNCRIEDRTHDEWIEENKEYFRNVLKANYQQNKEKVKEQHNKRSYEIAIYQKEYRLKNKEKLNQRTKEWRGKNKEKFKRNQREYELENKDRINERKRIRAKEKKTHELEKKKLEGFDGLRYNCCCGSNVCRYERNKHFATKKHQNYINLMNPS